MNPRYEMPENLYFGGGGDTQINALAAVALVCAVVLTCILPRKHALVALLAGGLLLPASATIVVAGLHFSAFRILLLAGWLRIVLRREVWLGASNSLDKIVLTWALYSATMFCILWGWAAVTNRLGFLYTTLGSYFLLRSLIRDKNDVLHVLKALAIMLGLLAPLLISEHLTGHNPLSILGTPESSSVRNGEVRTQGPFQHAIICGTLGATMLPAFMALWWQGRSARLIAAFGVFGSLSMTIASSSSTPAMAFAAGMIAWFLWPARRYLRWLRWSCVAALVALHLVMNAPVWFLISRMGGIAGGSGWHRATLIDTFIRHFGEWWLYGTRNNADWGYYMWDVDNAFVSSGLQGGLVTFALFIAIFVCAFRLIGNAWRKSEDSAQDARMIWAIGCALFANTVAFFGIFYFDQSILAWYGLLAMISVTSTFSATQKLDYAPDETTIDNVQAPVFVDSEISVTPSLLQL